MKDTMKMLTVARPARLAPGRAPGDPADIMRQPREHTRRPARRLVLAGAGLAAVAAVTAAAVALDKAPTGSPDAARPSPGAELDAADLLLVAAAKVDTGRPNAGRYWVVRAEHAEGDRRVTDEQWLATRAGDPSVAFLRAEAGDWSRRAMDGHTADNNFLLGGVPRSAEALAALPATPEGLRAHLLRWWPEDAPEPKDVYLFNAGADLVMRLPVPAPVRAAAYRMLAQMPGIDSLGRVTDALGRGGVAVAYGGGRQRLVVDPATGRALAQESWADGRRLGYTAVLKAEWADGAAPAAVSAG
ncbi:CU044_5270 family protein [Dactylosporangium sp. NPDC051485]|uniref:CU044_5270 family protein n=1 Tax=Dactylosporangium sp. NPDC051485 TaxID=3154846 RepID=UPI0034277632